MFSPMLLVHFINIPFFFYCKPHGYRCQTTIKRSKKVVSFLLLFSYKLDIMNVPFYMFLAYPNRRDISGLIMRFSHIILIFAVLKNGKIRVEN